VGLGWSPFTNGQWIMIPLLLDLAQLSAVGLAPYHYGGWLFDSSAAAGFIPRRSLRYPGYPVGPGRRFPRAFIPRVPSIVR